MTIEKMEIAEEKNSTDESINYKPWGMEKNPFCMLMHLSQLASVIIPLAGIVMPIVMWATNKDKSELVDRHGKNILNWIITFHIFLITCIILSFAYIGLPLLILGALASIAFIVIGGVKANDGIVYTYPLAIPFIR
jgi:hypothetical protein